MEEPAWLTRLLIEVIHDHQVAEHGGRHGVRDPRLIESALARPRHRWTYERDVDLADLAAAYGYALARSHPFVDGNKRIALMAVYTFLGLNDLDLDAPEPEAVLVIRDLAAAKLTEDEFAGWIRRHLTPVG